MAQVWFFRVSCLLGASSVILGAFAAHGLKQRLSPEMLSVFEVGVRYQMYHALAMLAVTLAVPRLWSSPWTAAACSAWLFG
ncbi:MAG: DUF423 domain-containing protein, partial [Candidatus Hydrogenedentes bacterium]|nr:DUF423 domain-containing protein [Candidatus Hydrogenedentota bacterium]